MWKERGEHGKGGLTLDEPTSLTGNVYLGSEQTDVPNNDRMIKAKTDLFNKMVGTDDKHRKYFTSDVQSWEYSMSGHQQQSVERYCELAGVYESTLREVKTPCIDDHQLNAEDFQVQGKLKRHACKIIIKCVYGARVNRMDI